MAIVVLAAGEAVFRPALAATLPALLPDRALLPAANALFDTTERSARLLGPGLVGVLAGALPVVHFFTLDAATFLLSAAAVLCLGRGPRPLPRPRMSLLGRHRRMDSPWCADTGCSGPCCCSPGRSTGLWVAAFYLALPLLIEQAGITGPGGTGLGAYGLVISAYGCTNLLATLGDRQPRLAGASGADDVRGFGDRGAGHGGARAWARSRGLPALMAASAFGAVGGPMKDIPAAVLRQTELPAGDVAAAMRAFMVVSYGGVLVAMLAMPSVVRALGPMTLVGLCGAGLVGLACWGLARHWSDGR